MTKLNTINCEEIMTEPLKPIEFVVDNLISQGLYIPAGDGIFFRVTKNEAPYSK